MREIPEIKCFNCYFAEKAWPDGEAFHRECHRRAPQVVVVTESQTLGELHQVKSEIVTKWPSVKDVEFCGEFHDNEYFWQIEQLVAERLNKEAREKTAAK